MMLMSDVDLKSYSNTAYHNEELKSLTRYRFGFSQAETFPIEVRVQRVNDIGCQAAV